MIIVCVQPLNILFIYLKNVKINLIFIFQLGGKPIIELSSLEEKWKHLSLPKGTLDELLR